MPGKQRWDIEHDQEPIQQLVGWFLGMTKQKYKKGCQTYIHAWRMKAAKNDAFKIQKASEYLKHYYYDCIENKGKTN